MKRQKTVVGIILSLMIALGVLSLTACSGECHHGKMIHHELQAATCTAQGTDEYWECPDCKKLFSDEEGKTVIEEIPVLEKTEHPWKTTFEKDADGHWLKCSVCTATTEHVAHVELASEEETDSTCVTKGKSGGTVCSLCDYVIVAPAEKDLLPHEMSHTAAKTANCSEKGNDEYWYCSSCKTYYTDVDGTEATTLEELEIAVDPANHSFDEWIDEVPAECGTQGTKGHKDCLGCGKHFDNDNTEILDLTIPADSHNFTSVTVSAQPSKTAYNVGETLVKSGLAVTAHCDNCGKNVTDAQFTVENEDKALTKGANEFTVKIGTNTDTFTVYAYETKKIAQNLDIMTTDTTATVPTSLFDGAVTALETAGQSATQGFTVSGGNITISEQLITVMKGGKTYGDFDVTFVTDAYYRYETTVSVVTKKIATLTELNAVKSDGNNVLDGYYVLTGNIDANNTQISAFCTYTNDKAKGLQGIFDGRGFAIINPVFDNYGIVGAVGQNGIVRNIAVVGAKGAVDSKGAIGKILGNEIHGGTFKNIYVDGDSEFLVANAWDSPTFENIIFVSSHPNASVSATGSNGTLTLKNIFVVGGSVYRYWGATKDEVNTQAFASVDALKAAVASAPAMQDIFGSGWTTVNNYPVMNSAADVHKTLAITNTNTQVTVDVAAQATANIYGTVFGLKQAKQGVTVTADGVITVTGVTGAGEFTVVATIGGFSVEKIFSYEKVEVVNKSGEFALLDLSKNTNDVDISSLSSTVTKIQSGDTVITEGFTQNGTTLTLSKSALNAILGSKAYGEVVVSIFTSDNSDRYCYVTNMTFATKLIASAQDLADITTANTADTIDAYYVVTADFDASSAGVVRIVNSNAAGSDTAGFKGIFDGRGHIISNLKTSATEYNGLGGLFGQLLAGSQVKNVAFTNMQIESNYKCLFVGESKMTSGTIENVLVTSSVENVRVIWNLAGSGVMKNMLVVTENGIINNNRDKGGTIFNKTSVSNIMSVTNNASSNNGGFSWTDDNKYKSQPNYATVDAMLDALESDNRLAAWNSPITYNNGAIYFNGTKVIEKTA